MNDLGTLAITARTRDESYFTIYTGDGGGLTPRVDTSGAFASFGTAVINNADQIAFFASLDSGVSGIFLGPDSSSDKVIGFGDALDGSEVTGLAFANSSLNDSGQVAFWASLADGRRGIFRAELQAVPEPSSLAPDPRRGVLPRDDRARRIVRFAASQPV